MPLPINYGPKLAALHGKMVRVTKSHWVIRGVLNWDGVIATVMIGSPGDNSGFASLQFLPSHVDRIEYPISEMMATEISLL